MTSTSNNTKEGTLSRLVRSLSRSGRGSSPKTELPPRVRSRSRGKDVNGAPLASPNAAALSTSPPPDSYFPRPPSGVYHDDEAAGVTRHIDTLGARATDIGDPDALGHAAPGVSFAPSSGGTRIRPDSELEGWKPAPRRTPSQRVRPQPSSSGNLTRARSTGNKENGVPAPSPPLPLPEGKEQIQVGERLVDAGERRGVTLEDKPLSRGISRSASVKRAASTFAKRAQKAFDPVAKEDGEKRILVLVADGSEEIETLTAVDLFTRAGLHPTLASLSPQFSPSHSLPHMTLSRGAKILADTTFETLSEEHKADFDAVYVPGGAKGAERLSQDASVQNLVWQFYESGKLVACICAGSLVAKTSKINLGGVITSHPSVKGDLEKHYTYSEDRVCVDGNLVTSRGPGTAIEHCLKVIELLVGEKKRKEVADPLCL